MLTSSMRSNYMREVNSSASEETSSKLSRSKSRKKMPNPIRLKEKEEKWDERFYLDQIPEYRYQSDPFGQGPKIKARVVNKSRDKQEVGGKRKYREVSIDKNRVSNKPNLKLTDEKRKEMLRKAFDDLKEIWFDKKIPGQHVDVMTKILSKENNPMKVMDDIKAEFADINKQTSLIQKAMISAQTRQICMSKINEVIGMIESHTIDRPGIEQKINHLRILTIHSIECIVQWKQHVESLSGARRIEFKHNGANYLSKIKTDYTDLKSSKLSSLYVFSDKPDPLYINVMVDNKKVFNVSKNLIKRIKFCEAMLEDPKDQGRNVDIENMESQTKLDRRVSKPPLPPSSSIKVIPQNRQQPKTDRLQSQLTKVTVQYSQFPQYYAKLCERSSIQPFIFGYVDFVKYQEFTVLTDKNNEIILAIDRNSSQRKIIILAIQSRVQELECFLSQVSGFLFLNDHCSQIRISLLHVTNQNGHLAVNSDIEKRLKGLGFRWVCVSNNQDIRTTVYTLKRPLNTKPFNAGQSYPIMIQHVCTFSLQKTNTKKLSTNCFMGVLNLLKLICEKDQKAQEEIAQNEDFEPYLEKLGTVVEFSYPGLKAFRVQNEEQLDKIVNSCVVRPQLKLPGYISLLNVSFKFKNSIAVDDKFTKVFPDKENEIVICESIYPVYLLSTDEQNISIFLFEVEANFTTSQVQSVFHSMGNQSSFIDEFWIPLFSQQTKYTDQLSFPNHSYVSTDYRSKLQSITRRSKTRTKVIKPPFVFGLINKELGQILQVPFFSMLVSKEDVV